MSPSQPLKIAVLGMGGIGSTFAFQLARVGGQDVTAIARLGSPRLGQLERDGGVVNIKGERAEMRVTDALDEQTPYDLVIVTLLAHQVDAVLPALRRSAAKCIQFMFNTFDPERLLQEVGAERCALGMPFVQAMVEKDGRLKAKVDAPGQKSKMSRQESVDIFNAAGLPAVLEPEMALWLRCHVPLCVAFESVSVAGMRRGGGASWGEAVVLARGLQECFTLIRRLGYRLYPAANSLLLRSPVSVVAGILWGMSRIVSFRELLATGAAECRALVDVLLESAAQARPAVAVAKIEAMKPL